MLDKLYIAGEWTDSLGGGLLPVIDPATEAEIGQVAAGTPSDIDRAVEAARAAFPGWSALRGAERGRYLVAFADAVLARRDELALLSSRVNGKPVAEALVDLDDVIATFRYYADAAGALDERQNQPVALAAPDYRAATRFEPAGVVGLITPWNFPLLTSAWKIAPALAAGCTVVLKPSEVVAPVELELGHIATEIGLPAGVLNIVTGTGPAVGAALCAHPGVAKLSFTGSNAVGAEVMRSAAAESKAVSLELGGKSPILIFADADLDKAVDLVIAGIFYNCGQMCSATSRLLVEASIADQLLDRLASAAEAIRIGPGTEPGVGMGPLTMAAQHRKVEAAVAQGLAEGARLVTGGARPASLPQGLFFQPTIFDDVSTDSALWRNEIFGPVLAVRRFADEAEAIALANDSEFGLAATLVTADEARIERVSAALQAGHVWVNSPQVVFVETSWGGFKRSGIGRELGPWGLAAYIEIKHVVRQVQGDAS